MNKSTILTRLAIILLGGFFIFCTSKPESSSNQTGNARVQPSTNSTENAETKNGSNQIGDEKAVQDQSLTITNAEVRKGKNPGVYVTLSSGETRMIAETVKFKNNNFSEVKNFQKVFISPNKQFAAIDATGFEEAFVQIYDSATDTLHKRTDGKITKWNEKGLLEVKSCNLAGENCLEKISVDGKTPWVFRQQDSGIVVAGAKLLPTDDFISNIKKVKRLSIFAKFLETAGADAIKGTGPFTVFAPTNEAFEKLPKETTAKLLRSENKKQLLELIRNHVVAGEYNTVQIEDGMMLKTIGNDTLTASSNETALIKINGDSIITLPNIYSSNGIIQIVSEVLSR